MERRRHIERWFASRGVPQLVAGYSTEQRMDARALPFPAAWIALGTVLIWARRPGATAAESFIAIALALAGTALVLGLFLWARRHPPFPDGCATRPAGYWDDRPGPRVAAAIIQGSPAVALGIGGFVLLGVGIIYIVVGFGLLEIAGWALGHLRAQLGQISTLVARTLPVLLILVVFLLFASELWQAARPSCDSARRWVSRWSPKAWRTRLPPNDWWSWAAPTARATTSPDRSR